MYRFAPSPTGDMHIGNLRAAIINYVCSLQDKSGFILRIEDTDKERNIDGKDQEIFEILGKFGIKWDRLYYQHKNLKFHQEFAAKLINEKKAFLCFCTDDEIAHKKELAKKNGVAYRYDGHCEHLSDDEILNTNRPAAIRLKKPKEKMSFNDEIKGKITFEPENIDSFVILRADKTPTYNFACAVDDMLEGVNFVIRGEDHISNTPKQILIRHYLGFDEEFKHAHLPIILNEKGAKMSKRENSSSVKWLLQSGYLPEAIANYLLMLGNKTPREIFTMNEAVAWFDIKNISKSPAKFDLLKLNQINREHIKRATNARLSELFEMDEKFGDLIKFYTQEASLIPEIKAKISSIYAKKDFSAEFANEMKILQTEILQMPNMPENFGEFKEILTKKTALSGKKFFMPLRMLISGNSHGPELSELYRLIKDDLRQIVC